jgi:nuclear pore complex protein Nup133
MASIAMETVFGAIQEHVHALIRGTASGALDEESALQLIMDEFGDGRLRERPALQQLLRQIFETFLSHRVVEPVLLIDVLTLMDYDPSRVDQDLYIVNNEFLSALQVLAGAWEDMNPIMRESTYKLLWKRLYIWEELNDTTDLSDEDVKKRLAGTQLGWTLQNLHVLSISM